MRGHYPLKTLFTHDLPLELRVDVEGLEVVWKGLFDSSYDRRPDSHVGFEFEVQILDHSFLGDRDPPGPGEFRCLTFDYNITLQYYNLPRAQLPPIESQRYNVRLRALNQPARRGFYWSQTRSARY